MAYREGLWSDDDIRRNWSRVWVIQKQRAATQTEPFVGIRPNPEATKSGRRLAREIVVHSDRSCIRGRWRWEV
jgi:hypothetical protein